MIILRQPKIMQELSKKNRLKAKTIGFVPTMGALHEGHLSLIRKAREVNDIVVVSIFLNPVQFGPKEDFKCYPRPIKKDLALCKKENVDIVFNPQPQDMYSKDFKTYVFVEGLSDIFCGRSRPGHFRGVATVVAKLFNLVLPDIAYFGQKDAQQAAVIQQMVRDLNIPVKVKVIPIFRQKDGLAMSSRNLYLNESERKDALVLYESLNLAKTMVENKVRQTKSIINRMKNLIQEKDTAKIDYIAIVNSDNLKPVETITKNCLILLAVWIGKTRLIDNMAVKL